MGGYFYWLRLPLPRESEDAMIRQMHGVSDYDWSKIAAPSPPLTDAEKSQVAATVDNFKSNADVAAWVKTNEAKFLAVDPVFWRTAAYVLAFAEQKKFLSPDWFSGGGGSTPPPPPPPPPIIVADKKTPWLLIGAAAVAAMLLLRK